MPGWHISSGGGSGGSGDVAGPAGATDNDLVAFDGATGKLIKDTGILYTDVVVGPASATDNAFARFDGATGKLLQDSGLIVSDVAAGAITVTSTAGTAITLKNTDPAATTGASVAGDALAITAGNAVASTDTAGAAAGGAVTITSGAAARNTSGNANGGDINLTTGAGIGTGTTGKVVLPSAAGLNWSTDTGLARSAAGVVKVTDGSTGLGNLLATRIQLAGTSATDPGIQESAVTAGDLAIVKADGSDYTGARAKTYRYQGNNNPSLGSDGLRMNAGTYIQWFAADGDASSDTAIVRTGANGVGTGGQNGQFSNIKIATTTVNASGASSTATNLVPAGCILLGVTTRVTVAITSGDGGTSVDIGNGTDVDMYGDNIAFGLGTTTNLASHTASALAWKSAAENVVFTCVGGTFNGGTWRVCAHYLDLSPPSS